MYYSIFKMTHIDKSGGRMLARKKSIIALLAFILGVIPLNSSLTAYCLENAIPLATVYLYNNNTYLGSIGGWGHINNLPESYFPITLSHCENGPNCSRSGENYTIQQAGCYTIFEGEGLYTDGLLCTLCLPGVHSQKSMNPRTADRKKPLKNP